MSSIASFCLLNKDDLNEFVEVLGVPLRQRTRTAMLKHPLHKFRLAKTTELAEFHWPGHVFAIELPGFLETHSLDWSDYANKRVSATLTDAIGLPVDVFATPQTKKLAHALDNILDGADLVSRIAGFLKRIPNSETRTAPELLATAVFDALLILRYWIGRVTPSKYGVLEISC